MFYISSDERNKSTLISFLWSFSGFASAGFLLHNFLSKTGVREHKSGRFRVYMNLVAIGLGIEACHWYHLFVSKSVQGQGKHDVGLPPLSFPDDENLASSDITSSRGSPNSHDGSPRLAVFSDS